MNPVMPPVKILRAVLKEDDLFPDAKSELLIKHCHLLKICFPYSTAVLNISGKQCTDRCRHTNCKHYEQSSQKYSCNCYYDFPKDSESKVLNFLAWCKSADYDSQLVFVVRENHECNEVYELSDTPLFAAIESYRARQNPNQA